MQTSPVAIDTSVFFSEQTPRSALCFARVLCPGLSFPDRAKRTSHQRCTGNSGALQHPPANSCDMQDVFIMELRSLSCRRYPRPNFVCIGMLRRLDSTAGRSDKKKQQHNADPLRAPRNTNDICSGMGNHFMIPIWNLIIILPSPGEAPHPANTSSSCKSECSCSCCRHRPSLISAGSEWQRGSRSSSQELPCHKKQKKIVLRPRARLPQPPQTSWSCKSPSS